MEQTLAVKALTREDLAVWLDDKITKRVLHEIGDLIRKAHLDLGGGVVLDADKPENTAQNYAKMVGYIAGLRVILNIELDDEEYKNNA